MGRRGVLAGLVAAASLALGVVPQAVAAAGSTEAALPAAIAASSGFSDVPDGHPFATEISWLAGVGVTTGYADGTFHPVEVVSRQAMAAFLYRYAGRPEYTQPEAPRFTDVPIDHPFYTEITWLAAQGITAGYADGTFHPEEAVSRQAMAAFVYRFAHRPAFTPGEVPRFSDVATDSGFVREIEWLASSGITTGYADGTFHPVEDVSRQAMAAFVYRLDTNPAIGQEPVAPGPVTSVQVVGLGTSSVDLAWANPDADGFTGALVRRAQGSTPPASPSDGDLGVATTGLVNRWMDTGLVPGGTYSYAVFAQYADGTQVSAATVTVVVPAVASIIGTVTGTGGVPVPGVVAEVVGTDGGQVLATTLEDGTWHVAGLAAGQYQVCFVPAGVTAGAPTGYLSQCFDQVAPGGEPTAVTVVDGVVTTGVDAALTLAGAVSGTVTDAEGAPLAGVTVSVDEPGGRPVASATTDATGAWVATGLVEGTYGVCFDPAGVEGATSYTAQCYDALAPTQAPTPVTVTTGATATGIDARLATAGLVGAGAATLGADRAAMTPTAGVVAEASEATTSAAAMPVIASSALGTVGCADVLFIGARGSGEPGPGGLKQNPNDTTGGLGGPVATAYEAFRAAVSPDRTVQPVAVSYLALDVLPYVLNGTYIPSLWLGVKATREALTARAVQCPDERIVLAGYSQGAILMHRVLLNATTTLDQTLLYPTIRVPSMSQSILARIDAGILIADGDRVPIDMTRTNGTAPDSAVGIAVLDGSSSHARLGAALGLRVWSVCDEWDLVCDYRPGSTDMTPVTGRFYYAYSVHTKNYAGSAIVRDPATAAATQLRFPPPLSFATPDPLPTAQLGAPYTVRLQATGGTPPYTFKFASPLPAIGLTSLANGTWSGTPNTTGDHEVSFSVTDAAGRGVTQRFHIRVGNFPVLLSEGAGGVPANSASSGPAMSADGQLVAFASYASNLVEGDSNGASDVFLKDRATGQVTQLTKGWEAGPADGPSFGASISGDGRWVTFDSTATNLVESDTNGRSDVFLLDRSDGSLTMVSSGLDTASYAGSSGAVLSSDGSAVAFTAASTENLAGVDLMYSNVWVYDTAEDSLSLLSRTVLGDISRSYSSAQSISGDGRFVAFWSYATDIVLGNPRAGSGDDIVVDRSTGTARVVAPGAQFTSLSGDGQWGAFSTPLDLLPADTNQTFDVYVRNLWTDELRLVSVGFPGAWHPVISADGVWVAFGVSDAYVANLHTGAVAQVTTVAQSPNGVSVDDIVADGSWLVLSSQAPVVAGDVNRAIDVFAIKNPLAPW